LSVTPRASFSARLAALERQRARVLTGIRVLGAEVGNTGAAGGATNDPRRSPSDSRSVRLTVLGRIMVASVLVAAIAMAVWFLAIAGSSLPA
jgi:hypothetical protein